MYDDNQKGGIPMKRKLTILILAVFVTVVAVVSSTSAADKVFTIRIGNVTPPNNPLHQAFEKMLSPTTNPFEA